MPTSPLSGTRPSGSSFSAAGPVGHPPAAAPEPSPPHLASTVDSSAAGHQAGPMARRASPGLLDEAKRRTANAKGASHDSDQARQLAQQPETQVPSVAALVRASGGASAEARPLATAAAAKNAEVAGRDHRIEVFANKQSENLLDEFTALAMDSHPFNISIMKVDGSIVNKDSFKLIQKRLINRDGQVLWTLNTNGDRVFGMKSGGSPPIKHAILANADDDLAKLLEKPWGMAAVSVCSDWLSSRKDILNNKSSSVISAGCVTAEMVSGNDFRILFDNESGHFEPSASSLSQIAKNSVLGALSDESFCAVAIGFKHYVPGQAA